MLHAALPPVWTIFTFVVPLVGTLLLYTVHVHVAVWLQTCPDIMLGLSAWSDICYDRSNRIEHLCALRAILTVQSPEYAKVNITVDCVEGSNEEERQPAPGLFTLHSRFEVFKMNANFDHANTLGHCLSQLLPKQVVLCFIC